MQYTSDEQMKKNIFENKYAECFIARSGGEAVGMALVRADSQWILMD